MKRLTHKLANGLSTGYWSGRSKADLVERLAENENTGLTPEELHICLLYTTPSQRDQRGSRMPSSA